MRHKLLAFSFLVLLLLTNSGSQQTGLASEEYAQVRYTKPIHARLVYNIDDVTTTIPTTTTTTQPPTTTTTIATTTTHQQMPSTSVHVSTASVWDRLAQCESWGNWSINTGNGYYGGLQFDRSTWLSNGGGEFAPFAHQATREQQIVIAEKIRASRGYYPWPACARKLGLI